MRKSYIVDSVEVSHRKKERCALEVHEGRMTTGKAKSIHYSLDLRNKVVDYISEGNTYISASRLFKISAETVRRWYLRYKSEGNVNNKPRKGKKPRVVELEFVNYVSSHSGATLEEIGRHFNMTASGALYYMRKFGFKYKKKNRVTWKQKQVNEPNI